MNLTAVVLPFAAFLAAIVLLWNAWVGPTDLAILAVMYVPTGLGITIGYHRLLTHRAFDAPKPVRYALAVLGSMAVQGPVIDWVADHRKHHAFADEEGDPHSPHGHGGGFKGAVRGLWYAHMGWLLETQGQADQAPLREGPARGPGHAQDQPQLPLDRARRPAHPGALGFVLHGGTRWARSPASCGAGSSASSWSTTSRGASTRSATTSARRRFDLEDQSTNVIWLALPSLGESWHHNHHAFPRSANHGLRWWEIDISGLIIRGMEKIGLAYNVVTITPERQREREEAGSAPKRVKVAA